MEEKNVWSYICFSTSSESPPRRVLIPEPPQRRVLIPQIPDVAGKLYMLY